MKRSERLYAIGQLSANLAHELRNPLASITGAVAMLRRDRSPEARRTELLEIIEKECRRLQGLLTNFLEFAKPRHPNYHLVDIRALLESTISLAGHAIGQSTIRLRTDVAPGLAKFECDAEQLRQVVMNLAINAIQAMPGGGDIVLAARPYNGSVVIEVKDQGCGVQSEQLDKIFDPFFTTKENGTGLGLSVAHQIVAQHGGILKAENNADGGMTFTIILPMRLRAA
jgi:signal transduction histidine kinase